MAKAPQIPPIDQGTETGVIAETLEDVCSVYGVPSPPPLYWSLAASPTVLTGTWKLSVDIMNRGELPETLKQLIFLAVSTARRCEYCELVYMALCKVSGVAQSEVRAVMEDLDKVTPARTRAILRFAVKSAMAVHSLTDEDYDELRRLGLSDSELLEVMSTAATAVYFNILADGMQVEVDDTIRTILES